MAYAHVSKQGPIAEMNITPLVDVMLVMLVIFMIAAPVFTQAIPMDIPQRSDGPPPTKVAPTEIRIDASGEVFMNDQPAPLSALGAMFSAEAVRAGETLPVVEIDASGDADYQVVAKVLALAQNAGLEKIRFVR
ncbi:MAG: biopolymer transporter ExbD [Xanthomonadaceae bacterium]|nr:biopolymer transporter ExbD [Xanthomonadaceae bacterium]